MERFNLMKAVIYERYGPPEALKLGDVPKPIPGGNELLIRVRATTVSSGDWRARSLMMPRGFGSLGRLAFGIRAPGNRSLEPNSQAM